MADKVDPGDPEAADMKALEVVVRRRASLHYVNHADVEDIAGTIWYEAVKAGERGSPVPLNKAAMLLTRKARYYSRPVEGNRRRFAEYSAARGGESGGFPDVASRGTPGLGVEARDVLSRLPRNLARALVLCDMHGYTLQEAAAALGVSVATVHRWREHGREAFRRAWEG